MLLFIKPINVTKRDLNKGLRDGRRVIYNPIHRPIAMDFLHPSCWHISLADHDLA
jgi:hypothetical protein